MILSSTLYNKNKNQMFTTIHTILNKILDVASVPTTNDTIEFAIMRSICSHIDIKLCFRNLSYFHSLNDSLSILSTYHSLIFDCDLISYIIILKLCTHRTSVTHEYATVKIQKIATYSEL